MAKETSKDSAVSRWLELERVLQSVIPQLYAKVAEEEEFRELRFKLRDDRTTLAVLKVYGADGGELVCFGSGYGLVGALMAVEGTIASGSWKFDKPWDPSNS